jgi:hypothetical protein
LIAWTWGGSKQELQGAALDGLGRERQHLHHPAEERSLVRPMNAVEVGLKRKEPAHLLSARGLDLQSQLQADRAHAFEKLDALLSDAEGKVPDSGIEAHNVHGRLLRSDSSG